MGGARTVAMGGNFKAGFTSSAFTAFASSSEKLDFMSKPGQITAAGVIGGMSSELAGGKFRDGFINGAMGHGLNGLLTEGMQNGHKEQSFWERAKNYFGEHVRVGWVGSFRVKGVIGGTIDAGCLLYTSPSPRDS